MAYTFEMQTIAETPVYRALADQWLSVDEQDALREYLALHPTAGDLIQGTGGIRKLRWRRPGMGKRGGLRIIYFHHSSRMPLYLLAVFGKAKKSDLTAAERRELAGIARDIVQFWKGHYGQ